MDFTNYEGTAIDTEMFGIEVPDDEVQPEVEPAQTEPASETVEPDNEGTDASTISEPEDVPTEIDIPGLGKVTADEIKEWRQSGLRQADYTRKTQELARQREENKNAAELYSYLKQNPHLIKAMKEADTNGNAQVIDNTAPTAQNQLLQQVLFNQKAMETDFKVKELRQKYGDIDEIALYKKAQELRTDDLEFVYKGLMADKAQIDEKALIEKAKAELKAELEKNKSSVSTIVSTGSGKETTTKQTLTAEQKRVARGMGMSDEEYAKWV